MTANPSLIDLSEEQKNLVYNVREIYPALDTTDCVNLCKSCNWNRDIVQSTLAESNSSFGDSKWKEIDRTSKRKKKEGKAGFPDGFNTGKKKKTFNRRQRRGKNFDRKGRGKPSKNRKGNKGEGKKQSENLDQSRAKHLIQRTNAVANTSEGSWAAKARAPPPRPDPAPNASSPREPSSKSGKENERSNSSEIAPPPGIITSSVWTNVHNHDPDPEPEVDHADQYSDFFDSEQYNTQPHHAETETKKMFCAENLSSFQDAEIYPGPKFSEPAVKPDLVSFQIDHDRRSSASQYSRPIENIESIGVDMRDTAPEYNIPVETFVPDHHQYQFGEVTNSGVHDNMSRPVSEKSSAVAGTPFHSIHPSMKDNLRSVQISKSGVTMPPANSMMFPNKSNPERGNVSMFGTLVLPPEQEQLKMNGTSVYQFGVDFSEERKMESNELHHPPNHLQRTGRMDYAERQPYQQSHEVSHEMGRSANMNRNNRDLNLRPHHYDNHHFDAPNSSQHGKFEDISSSMMDSNRDPHGRPHLNHQRLEAHFEERKSNHTEIDDARNPNRINNQPMQHMSASRPFGRPDSIRGVPAEINEPFFSEAKRMEPPGNGGFDEPQPDYQNHPNHHAPYVPNPPQAFKPNTGFPGKESAYMQPSLFGVEQLQNLEGDKNGPSSTPPLVNANTHFYNTNQVTYYPHMTQAYTAPVPTYQPQYTTAPRTNVYSYSAAQVMSNPVYPYSQPIMPNYSMA